MHLRILLSLSIPANLLEMICCIFLSFPLPKILNSYFVKIIPYLLSSILSMLNEIETKQHIWLEGHFQKNLFHLVRICEKLNGAKFLASINWQISPIMCHWSNLMWVANPPEENNQHFSSHRGQCKSCSLPGNIPKCPVGLYSSNLLLLHWQCSNQYSF